MGILRATTKMVASMLGTTNKAQVKAYLPTIAKVTAQEEALRNIDDEELRSRHTQLKEAAQTPADLDRLQVDAFALIREVADRRLGIWNAIAGTKGDFDNDVGWGNLQPQIDQARQRLQAGDAMWSIDLPASVYQYVRQHFESVPPFRMRAHDVQLIGGCVLHEGKIGELKTGEGKTLVAAFPAYLNALLGKGVHVVTVNDYLAHRDAEWNAPIYRFLGMDCGAIQAQMPPQERAAKYACDVTYGTNSEFGFDYLRDNLKQSLEEQVCKHRYFGIVDEVDSVLIDEARTPLIISGPAQGRENHYQLADDVVRQLEEGEHYDIDIKDRQATLTEAGFDKAAELVGAPNLYTADWMHLPHYLDNALKAHYIFKRDIDYLVSGKNVKIIDESTGRTLEGRRWSEGLHQAVECKEGVPIQPESQTFASITYQNYFRMYDKLSGMTGTAMTEAAEFAAIYKLESIAVPTNRPIIRRDMPDLIYGSVPEKFNAIVEEVQLLHRFGQPVLVGTASVEASELLSEQFKRKGIKHNLLNARHHEREAEIVAGAGHLGAVTIATNMAGRGTDIVLTETPFATLYQHWQANGLAPKKVKIAATDLDDACLGLWVRECLDDDQAEKLKGKDAETLLAAVNKERDLRGWAKLDLPTLMRDSQVSMRQLGGLAIVGTERHESRRIDNQLRGRSGRQGDPGFSRFFISLEDQLMKRFAGEGMRALMVRMGLKDGMAIESNMVSKRVEKAQKRVEEVNFGFRKNLLEYDEVMNIQRKQIYGLRQKILTGEELTTNFNTFLDRCLDDLVQQAAGDGTRGNTLAQRISEQYAELFSLPAPKPDDIPVMEGGDECRAYLIGITQEAFTKHQAELGDFADTALRFVLIDTIDRRWTNHIDFMDQLRRGITLQAYGQKDPKLRFKEEGYRHFEMMYELIRRDVCRLYFTLKLRQEDEQMVDSALKAGGFAPVGAKPQPKPAGKTPMPNDPCPCGSGAPYGKCHGF